MTGFCPFSVRGIDLRMEDNYGNKATECADRRN